VLSYKYLPFFNFLIFIFCFLFLISLQSAISYPRPWRQTSFQKKGPPRYIKKSATVITTSHWPALGLSFPVVNLISFPFNKTTPKKPKTLPILNHLLQKRRPHHLLTLTPLGSLPIIRNDRGQGISFGAGQCRRVDANAVGTPELHGGHGE